MPKATVSNRDFTVSFPIFEMTQFMNHDFLSEGPTFSDSWNNKSQNVLIFRRIRNS